MKTTLPLAVLVLVATQATFSVERPIVVNLRDRPAKPTDVILGITVDGTRWLDGRQVPTGEVGVRLSALMRSRGERILYIDADKRLRFSTILDALDAASKAGACAVGLIGTQRPSTTSWVADDVLRGGGEMRHAVFLRLPDPAYAGRWAERANDRVLLEIRAPETRLINGQATLRANQLSSLRRIFNDRPDKALFIKGDPRVSYALIMDAIDIARAPGGIILGFAATETPEPTGVPRVDPTRRVTQRDEFTGPGAAPGMASCS